MPREPERKRRASLMGLQPRKGSRGVFSQKPASSHVPHFQAWSPGEGLAAPPDIKLRPG